MTSSDRSTILGGCSVVSEAVWWRMRRLLPEMTWLRLAAWEDERRSGRREAGARDRIIKKLSLREYRELLAGVPTPSRAQLEAFARFVSTAHSWYKHLRRCRRGFR